MKNSSKIRTGRHCTFKLYVHLVFVTKYQCKVFTKPILEEMQKILERVCISFEAVLTEFDGRGDHVHLLVNYPPKVSISGMVNSLKGVSSRLLRKKFPELEKRYWKGGLWSPSYFAASGRETPIPMIQQYIKQQKKLF